MATHITQIGRQKFVCGLFWQSLSRPRELKKEAKDLARKIDSDLMVLIRDHATAQAGFAQTKDGARRMAYSLAAAVSSTLSREGGYYDGRVQPVHDWLGAFKLPDGMWAYFAVRDANFLPNGDFAGTKEEVLDRLHGDYGLGGWNMVVGDAELEEHGFHNFNARSIEELIPHKKNGQIQVQRGWALRPVESEITSKTTLIAIGLAAVLAIGGVWYWKQVQKKKEAEERERAIEAARQKLMVNTAQNALPKPWLEKPSPVAAVHACVGKFSHMVPGGWQLDSYECTSTQATYTWSRNNSTIGLLLAQVPGANVDISGDKATYSEPLQLQLSKENKLVGRKELLDPLVSDLQLLRLTPKVVQVSTPAPAPQSPIPGMGQVEPPPPEWQTYSITLPTGGLSPVTVATILDRPGVRLEKIAYKGGTWSLEGVMYAK
jgi:hypothetical protein